MTHSVHLENWPDVANPKSPDFLPKDEALIRHMDQIREFVSIGNALRAKAGIPNRQVLPAATIQGMTPEQIGKPEYLDELLSHMRDELNVRKIHIDPARPESGEILKPDGKAIGPRLGKAVQDVFRMARAGEWQRVAGGIQIGPHLLKEGEYTLQLKETTGAEAALPGGMGILSLDTRIGPEEKRDGLARNLQRSIQQARKAMGLDPWDQILLGIQATKEQAEALQDEARQKTLQKNVLAAWLEIKAAPETPNLPWPQGFQKAAAGEATVWIRREDPGSCIHKGGKSTHTQLVHLTQLLAGQNMLHTSSRQLWVSRLQPEDHPAGNLAAAAILLGDPRQFEALSRRPSPPPDGELLALAAPALGITQGAMRILADAPVPTTEPLDYFDPAWAGDRNPAACQFLRDLTQQIVRMQTCSEADFLKLAREILPA